MKTPLPAPALFCSSRHWGKVLFLVAAPFLASSFPLAAQDVPPETAPADESFSPKEYGADRYQKIRGKSPFEFELAQPKTSETVDPFADFVLAGFAGSASRPTVYLLNTKTQERLTVLTDGAGKKNESGFRIISVNRGRTLTTTTAKIEKDGQQKDLAFDSKALSSMSGGAGGGGAIAGARPGPPGQPGVPGLPPQGGAARPLNGQAPAQRPPVQPFATPQANINFPNQANRNAAQAQAQQAQAGGLQPANAGAAGGGDAQQQLNTLLNNNNQGIPQPTAAPIQAPPNSGNPPPRRRVVLPTPAP